MLILWPDREPRVLNQVAIGIGTLAQTPEDVKALFKASSGCPMSGHIVDYHVEFDNCHFVLYSYKGLASCVFCSRATAL
jgi:hypothetical protein